MPVDIICLARLANDNFVVIFRTPPLIVTFVNRRLTSSTLSFSGNPAAPKTWVCQCDIKLNSSMHHMMSSQVRVYLIILRDMPETQNQINLPLSAKMVHPISPYSILLTLCNISKRRVRVHRCFGLRSRYLDTRHICGSAFLFLIDDFCKGMMILCGRQKGVVSTYTDSPNNHFQARVMENFCHGISSSSHDNSLYCLRQVQ